VLKRIRQTRVVDSAGTWDCGYLRPTSRIQYTGSSLGQMLVGLLRFMLWPKTVRPSLRDLFPHGAHFKSLVPDAILDRIIAPLFGVAGKHLPRLRYFQQGQTQVYVLYILAIVIVLLLCGSFGV
jgi:hydrogenase-4 component B